MKRLFNNFASSVVVLSSLSGMAISKAGETEGWAVVGWARSSNAEAAWIKLKNSKQINPDSFKVPQRGFGNGSLKINCRNKDIKYADGFGWNQRSKDDPSYGIAQMLCRFIPAREIWGFSKKYMHLWNAPIPPSNPREQEGEWIEHLRNAREEIYYNDDVISDGRIVMYASYSRRKKIDQEEITQREDVDYYWIIADCKKNLTSTWYPTGERFFKGFWTATSPGAPLGTARTVKRNFCSKPNSPILGKLAMPTIETLTRFQGKGSKLQGQRQEAKP